MNDNQQHEEIDNNNKIENDNNTNSNEDVDLDDDDDSSYFNYLSDGDSLDSFLENGHIQRAIIDLKSNKTILKLIDLFPIEVQQQICYGEYPLHMAYHHQDVMMKLFEIFPEATQHPNSSKLYPLHLALIHFSYHQSVDVVMKIIEIFPDAVNKSTTYGTALHIACCNGLSVVIIRKLIEIHPLAIHEKDFQGRYPIHCAIIGKQSSTLDCDPLGMQRRAEGCFIRDVMPLHIACENNSVDVVKLLLYRSDFQINIRDSRGRTPLHYVCDDTIIEILLNHPNVEVNATEQMNDTPLNKFVRFDYTDESYADQVIQAKIVQKLLDHPFIIINQKNIRGQTPLDAIKADLTDLFENHHEYSNPELLRKVSHLLEEFIIKRRWQAYCYHLKNIKGDHL